MKEEQLIIRCMARHWSRSWFTWLTAMVGRNWGNRITINCFTIDPSVKSSLTFLRKTPWARKKVEDLYLDSI